MYIWGTPLGAERRLSLAQVSLSGVVQDLPKRVEALPSVTRQEL
jgi:hypothetical protein